MTYLPRKPRCSHALVALLAFLTAACHPEVLTGTVAEAPGNRGKFEKVWKDYDQHYVLFASNPIDWASVGTRYRAAVDTVSSDRSLAFLLGAMVGELRDYHADITTGYGTFGAPPIPYARHFSPAVLQAHYFATPIQHTNGGHVDYTRLPDGTGYLYIGTFAGSAWGGEFSSALAALADAPSLIIDIRNNGGGDEAIAQDVAAHFYDRTRVYRKTRFKSGTGHADLGPTSDMALGPRGARYDRPVALITNRFNGSSAEDFTLMMRVLPTVVTVGDTTLGLGSNPLTVKLSNGWSYRIPQSMQSTPDGFVYQWRGLPPAIPVRWAVADTVGGRDPYIDAALAELKRRRGENS